MQRLVEQLPDSLKPFLRRVYRVITGSLLYRKLRGVLIRKRSKEKIHTYWMHPWDRDNLPQEYLNGKERSEFLLGLVKEYCQPSYNIMEIGCNVGRNLNHLFLAGYNCLWGVEINEEAVGLLKQSFPEMARHTQIINGSAEEVLPGFEDGALNVVFSMAVLQHIHPNSESIFSEMARITSNYIITVEDELMPHWRNFPRNYKEVFEPLGFYQIYECNCENVPGLNRYYIARVLKKR